MRPILRRALSSSARGATPPTAKPAAAANAAASIASAAAPEFVFHEPPLPKTTRPMPTTAFACVDDLLAQTKTGWSLEQPWYTSDIVFKADIARVWKTNWLFAAHSAELKQPGDYVTLTLDKDSLVIVRGDDGKLRAFHNVCRHRGSRLCKDAKGKVKKNGLVCPYHQWSYDRTSGALKHFTHFPKGFVDTKDLGLHEAGCEELNGLVFIHLGETPNDFSEAREFLGPHIIPHNLGHNAKVAEQKEYLVEANWKLVYENNRECYHCNGSHPEYIKANYDTLLTYNAADDEGEFAAAGAGERVRGLNPGLSEKRRMEVSDFEEECSNYWSSLGLPSSDAMSTTFRGWYKVSRVPPRKGWVTESLDGKRVCDKIMARPANAPDDWDENGDHHVGSLRMHTFPNHWMHASVDHAVTTRILPVSPTQSKCLVTWLVPEDAVEGVDYHLDELLPVWERTSEQDYELCEVNQEGVNSSRYTPGPYSPTKEHGVAKFVDWYLDEIRSNSNRSGGSRTWSPQG